jgi:hypothetical protein
MDILVIFSFAGLLLSFIIGFIFKDKYGWFLLVMMPILGPGRLVLVPSTVAPLDFYQITILGILGILTKSNHLFKGLSYILKDRLFLLIVIFTLIRFIISETSRYPYLFFSWVPQMLISFLLVYIIVHNRTDIDRILRIYSIQGAFIGIFIVIGYYTDFSLEELFRSTIPGYNIERIYAFVRSYNVRVNGLDGSAVLTAARLTVLIFISQYCYFFTRNRVVIVHILLIIMGLVLLQTRAAFVSILISGSLLLIPLSKLPQRYLKNIFRKSIPLVLLIMASLSTVMIVMKGFFPMLLNSITNPLQNGSMLAKLDRIPIAIQYFLLRPFTGYGSPHHVYYDIMQTNDLPAPFIYLLSGGIFMFMLYMIILLYMPYKIYRYYQIYGDISLLFISMALLAGIIMPMSNWIETHFVIMLILYASVNKVYSKICLKRK